MTSRRTFLTGAAAVGGITLLPYRLQAAAHAGDSFATTNGTVSVHPVSHASFVMETPAGTIFVDPVGDVGSYSDFRSADLVLITHEHGDHFDAETLAGIMADGTQMIVNPNVYDQLPGDMQTRATPIGNRDNASWGDVGIEAIPAYNVTEDRLNFHPQGRDNGYVVSIDGMRIYISGDTEDIPEMRALTDIDLAFVCMNLPFTMDAEAAASAVAEFVPTYVYPYHYRGRDNGTQDPAEFANLLSGETEVKMGDWYG